MRITAVVKTIIATTSTIFLMLLAKYLNKSISMAAITTTSSSSSSSSLSLLKSRVNHLAYFDATESASVLSNQLSFPQGYTLEKVVIIHRHGDRSQISRSLGLNYPENEEITKTWFKKLPNENMLRSMVQVARKFSLDNHNLNNLSDIRNYLYDGWDKDSIPYGQLTSMGMEQMIALGSALGARYLPYFYSSDGHGHDKNISFHPKHDMFLRSTDSCRTVQSLRSFLIGFFHNYTNDLASIPPSKLPIINTRSKDKETLVPQADGSCEAISIRRSILTSKTPIYKSMSGFYEFESKIKKVLGFSDHVPWLTVKEVITCQLVHDIPLPSEITVEDDERTTKLAAWLWGQLFHDKMLNRLAIGRFIHEFIEDLENFHLSEVLTSSNGDMTISSSSSSPKIVIYSGHDSTLVPFMCALDVYDDTWPPYASYFALEIVRSTSGERFVRGIFNDEVRKLYSEEIWYPYNKFLERLKLSSISRDDYQNECSNPSCHDGIDDDSGNMEQIHISDEELNESRKEMAEEIQATLGGLSQKSGV